MSKLKRAIKRTANFFSRSLIKGKIALVRAGRESENSQASQGIKKVIHFIMRVLSFVARKVGSLVTMAFVLIYMLANRVKEPFFAAFAAVGEKLENFKSHISGKVYVSKHKKRDRIAAVSLMATATVMICSLSYFGVGLEVFLDGQSVGFVSSRDEVTKVIHDVELKTAEYIERPYNLQPNITYSLGYIQRDNLLDTQMMFDTLFERVDEVSEQYVMTVDGEIVGANISQVALEDLRAKFLTAGTPDIEGARSEFVQEVKIEARTVATTHVKSITEIEDALRSSQDEVITYNVKNGDTLSQIANNYGLSTQTLLSLNPEVNPEGIAAGASLNITKPTPRLSVKSFRTVTYSEPLVYDVDIEYSDSMLKTESKVRRKGVMGEQSIVADLVYLDGAETDKNIVSTTIVQAPVNEIKVIGTKTPPAKAATGSFLHPFRGIISSRYGSRWGSEFHTGLDLAGAAGSTVKASDGGTVTLAKRNGNYGNCVIIDHGNGYQTLYAHNSKLLVSQGQKVAKGEKISLVGSTGRSTGPHLHFEILKNGKTVNPLNYIS